MEIFGARAAIYLKYDNSIEELANKLSKGLLIPTLTLQKSEYPPYRVIGSCETFGHEIWLERDEILEGFPFSLKYETQLNLEESFVDQMHDMSPWLARYLSRICDIDCCVLDSINGNKNYFKANNKTN